MKTIKLPNRDGAILWLEHESGNIWKLKVDPKHNYCLEYMRMGGKFDADENGNIRWEKIRMIDPSGGPYMELGDTIKEYKIVEFIDSTTMKLERNNN